MGWRSTGEPTAYAISAKNSDGFYFKLDHYRRSALGLLFYLKVSRGSLAE
jgi:hypothetical protein